MEKSALPCCCGLLICTQFAMLISTGSMAIAFYNKGVVIPNTDYINQIVRDWETLPFTNIEVFTEDQGNCDDYGLEPVFQHEWLGTDIACDCLGIFSEWIKYPNEFAVGAVCERNETLYGCYSSPPLPPIVTTRFQGRSICGQRSQEPFINITRPEYSNTADPKCPQGYRSCFEFYGRSDLNTENQVCFLDSQDTSYFDQNCPIVAMNFTQNDIVNETETYLNYVQINPSDWSNSSFSIVAYNSTHNIVYSKAMDSLPIVSTYVGSIPCLDPFQTSIESVNTYSYQADLLGQNAGCQSQPNGYRIDNRYQDMGFAVSESQIKSSSRLDQIYRFFRTTDSASYSDSVAVEGTQYDFWIRPTIPWKLSCESIYPRQDVLQDFSVRLSYNEGLVSAKYKLGLSVVIITSTCWVLPLICCAGVIMKNDTSSCYFGSNMITMLILAIPMMIYNAYEWNLINTDLQRLDELKWTESCTDQYSQVGSVDFIENGFDDIFTNTQIQFYLTVTFFVIFACQFFTLCCAMTMSGVFKARANNDNFSYLNEAKEFIAQYKKFN